MLLNQVLNVNFAEKVAVNCYKFLACRFIINRFLCIQRFLSLRLSRHSLPSISITGIHLSGYLGQICWNVFFFLSNSIEMEWLSFAYLRFKTRWVLLFHCAVSKHDKRPPHWSSASPADATVLGLRQDVLSGKCLLCREPKHYEMRLRAQNMTNILRCAACKVTLILSLMQHNHTFFLKGSSLRFYW